MEPGYHPDRQIVHGHKGDDIHAALIKAGPLDEVKARDTMNGLPVGLFIIGAVRFIRHRHGPNSRIGATTEVKLAI